MSQPTPDEKKHVILSLIDSLRQHNPSIGEYVISILNADFEYSVKLTNGSIKLSKEIVEDFELSPRFVDEQQLKSAATRFASKYSSTAAFIPPTPVKKADQETQISKSTSPKRNSGYSRILSTIVILILVWLGIYGFNQLQEHDAKAAIRNHITSYVIAERSNYKYSLLGGIHDLSISVTNNTNYLVEKVQVKITYLKANGEYWDTKTVDFDMLGPRSGRTIKIEDTNRGTSINYEIISIKSNALGLY